MMNCWVEIEIFFWKPSNLKVLSLLKHFKASLNIVPVRLTIPIWFLSILTLSSNSIRIRNEWLLCDLKELIPDRIIWHSHAFIVYACSDNVVFLGMLEKIRNLLPGMPAEKRSHLRMGYILLLWFSALLSN